MKKISYTILWVTVFAIAMAFMESSIVIYLRKFYYPEGFSFPLQTIDFPIAVTEFIREVATIIMLLTIGLLVGRNGIEKFAFFIFPFAIWDIFYYVFLKVLIGWPESLLTWDVLFLVPTTWVGPVITPVINSLTMIILAMIIVWFVEKKQQVVMGFLPWFLLILGSIVVLVSYTEEYISFMSSEFTFWQLLGVSDKDAILSLALQFIPQHFKWWIFLMGEAMHLAAIGVIIAKNR
jgi:hypothetical protein